VSGRRYGPPGPALNGGQHIDPRARAVPAGVPIIGQRHKIALALSSSDGQPPTVIEVVGALAQMTLAIVNLQPETDLLAEGKVAQADMMGDVEATLVVMRAACAFQRVLLEQHVALAERRVRRQGQSESGEPADGGVPEAGPDSRREPAAGDKDAADSRLSPQQETEIR